MTVPGAQTYSTTRTIEELSPQKELVLNRTLLPEQGCDWKSLKIRMQELKAADWNWRTGQLPLHSYFAGSDVTRVAEESFALFLHENALAPQAFPSVARMESDVVSMALEIFGGGESAAGSITSGGTESITLALKAARDRARKEREQSDFNIVISSSTHPAFDKAAQLLGLGCVRVPVGADFAGDAIALEGAIDDQTILIVASAPSLPYGIVDNVEELGRLAIRKQVWLHVDACIGGLMAPFARQLGYNVPKFDFAVPGVRSISADLHKFGYSAKGASLILYASHEDHSFQFSEFNDWPKGQYTTKTLAGSRSGGPIASAWAVMHHLGRAGYLDITRRVMRLRQQYLEGFSTLPDLTVIGRPQLSVIAVTSGADTIFSIAECMRERGWYMSLVADPPAIHQTINLVHEKIADRYLNDLVDSVTEMKAGSFNGSNSLAPTTVVTY